MATLLPKHEVVSLIMGNFRQRDVREYFRVREDTQLTQRLMQETKDSLVSFISQRGRDSYSGEKKLTTHSASTRAALF